MVLNKKVEPSIPKVEIDEISSESNQDWDNESVETYDS